MNKFNKLGIVATLALSLVIGFVSPNNAFAATSPSLGTESTYGIVSSTYTNSLNAGTETTINGDVCYTTGPATAPIAINGATTVPCPPATGTAQAAAIADLNSQACTSLGANVVLSGTYTPGCYSSTGTMDIVLSTTITLNGPGTYIFRSGGALTTGANSVVALTNGANANDVFWVPGGATTLGANSSTSATPTFVGNIMQNASNAFDVTLGHFVHLLGRVLAFGRTVTTDSNTITVPTTLRVVKTVVNDNSGVATASSFNVHVKLSGADVAGSPASGAGSPGTLYTLSPNTYVVSEDANASYAASFSGDCNSSGSVTLVRGDNKTCTITNNDVPPPAPGPVPPPAPATINVVKTVVNDNGRTNVVADFPLFVNSTLVVSGATNTFTPGTYTVSETSNSNYTQTISGDCDAAGNVTIVPGDNKFCIITNNDIAPASTGGGGSSPAPVPPLIEVVKTASPLSLPNGPGSVTYTYTLRNIGTVPVTNITMVGDTCSPIVLVSGDTNNDLRLDVSEVWTHTCSTTLTSTHTNTVVATGWANGISTVDIASATVVVGSPLPPPLIHVTKVPNRFVAYQGGTGSGDVMYVYNITNPGTVAMSNVTLTDDKCSQRFGPYGDENSNGLLDTNESWAYACLMNIAQTITNTAVATGSANGFTARDFAVVTVVVAGTPVVLLPNTGFSGINVGGITALIAVLMLGAVSLVAALRKRTI